MNTSTTHFTGSAVGVGNAPRGIDAAQPEQEDAPEKWSRSLGSVFGSRTSKRSLLFVFRQLALLVETGIDVAEALELVAASCKNGALQESLEDIFDDIGRGTSLSLAVRHQEHRLGRDVVASIQAGEASGRLVEVLRQIADQLEQDLKMRSTIATALAYPMILTAAASLVTVILVWFVLPQFESSFESMGVTPPVFTQMLLSLSSAIRENLLIVGVSAAAFLAALVALGLHPTSRVIFGNLCFGSPIVGVALRHLIIGKLFVSLGHLLRNGISLLDAIQLVSESTPKGGAIGRLVEAWENDVLEGRGLTHSLAEFPFLPDGADAMIIMAEKTGKLDEVLTTAGIHYRDEGSARVGQLLKLSEPLIIIVLGIFVGITVASVLLPMLDVQAAGAAR